MKSIVFRPLRRIKKTGKVTVASYMQWRKVKTADYNEFKLVIDNEYKTMPPDELVYNHEGENLFWRDFNPEQIPMLNSYALVDGEPPPYPPMWKTDYKMFCAKGLDVDGVPTFSHGTQKEITNCNMYHYTIEELDETLNPMKDYELLTVAMVVKWFGWFIYQLEKSNLQIGK